MSSSSANKKRKLNNNVAETIQLKPSWEYLFCQDWFLFEMGKQLIGKFDNNLLKILVLNKTISKRAISHFQQHFFNTSLQNQLERLIKDSKFDQVQQLFEKHPLALNPNVRSSDLSIFECFHDQHKSKWNKNFDCCCGDPLKLVNQEESPALAVAAMKCGLISLFRSTMLHPRTNFTNFSGLEFVQLFDCAAFNGEFEIMNVILEKGLNRMADWSNSIREFQEQFKYDTLDSEEEEEDYSDVAYNRKYRDFGFDMSFAIANSIHNDNWKVFSFLMNLRPNQKILRIHLAFQRFPFLDMCFKMGEKGLKYYEMFLNSRMIFFHINQTPFIERAIKHGGEFFLISIKALLARSDIFIFEEFSKELNNKILNYFEKHFKGNKEAQKLEIRFAMVMEFTPRIVDTVKKIINRNNFNDSDLLDLLKTDKLNNALHKDFHSIEFILNQMSRTTLISSEHVERLLLSCIQFERIFDDDHFRLDQFSLVFNDSRVIKTLETIHKIYLRTIKKKEIHVFKHFERLVKPYHLTQYNIGTSHNPEFVNVELRVCTWFEITKKLHEASDIEETQQNLEIVLTEELFDIYFKMFLNTNATDASLLISQNFEILELSSIKQEWWTENRVHSLLLNICKHGRRSLPIFLLKFPNVDLSRNNNEALRVLLEESDDTRHHDKTELNCRALAERIKFSSQNQRKEFLYLTRLKTKEESNFLSIVGSIRVDEKSANQPIPLKQGNREETELQNKQTSIAKNEPKRNTRSTSQNTTKESTKNSTKKKANKSQSSQQTSNSRISTTPARNSTNNATTTSQNSDRLFSLFDKVVREHRK